jgi:hypothetical protein
VAGQERRPDCPPFTPVGLPPRPSAGAAAAPRLRQTEAAAIAVAQAAEGWCERHARDVFAGGFVHPAEDGWCYYAAFAAEPAANLERLRAAVPHPERLRLYRYPARYALAELRALQRRVDADTPAWRGEQVLVTTTGVDVFCNLVEIGVGARSTPRAAELLAGRYGADRVRVVTADPVLHGA